MKLLMWLAALGGARPGLLKKAPGDIPKHATLGGVLISTALVSSASAFFALYSALRLPVALCVPIAACWGLIILNLDRMLVVSMGRQNGFWLNLWMMLPRLLLAAVIGTVISMPLVLRIFQPEIDSELTIMRAEDTTKARQANDAAFAQITKLEQREKELQDTIAGNTQAAVSADSDVKTAQAAYDAAVTAYQQAQAAADCELDGTCGTRQRGNGDSAQQKQRVADDARKARDDAKDHLDKVTETVTQRLQNEARSKADAAAKELPTVQGDLARYRDQRKQAEAAANDAESKNTGLLARLEALSRITENRPSGGTAHWALFLLFFSIEVLPVLSKFLASLGAPTVYDRLLAREDDGIDRADDVRSKKEQSLVDAKADLPVQLELHKTAAQLAGGKAAMDALADRQTKIALRAIDVWGDLAARRTDEELDQWYRQHIGRTAAHPPAPAFAHAFAAQQTMPMRPVSAPPNGFGPHGATPNNP
jgi:hypothetical protein